MNNQQSLPAFLLEFLEKHPAGLSEYQLICQLRELAWPGYANASLNDPLQLFRCHFTLFNALFRLDNMLVQKQLQVQIDPLCIRLMPRSVSAPAVSCDNPLRNYYLDISQLDSTDREQVTAMLNGTLQRIQQRDLVGNALLCLELSAELPTPRAADIRKNYRRLASLHHPDRGGSTRRIQELNDAYAVLKKQGLC